MGIDIRRWCPIFDWASRQKNAEKKCRLFARINHQISNSKSYNEKLNSRLWHLIQLQNTWKGSISIYTSFSLDG